MADAALLREEEFTHRMIRFSFDITLTWTPGVSIITWRGVVSNTLTQNHEGGPILGTPPAPVTVQITVLATWDICSGKITRKTKEHAFTGSQKTCCSGTM